MNTTSAACPWGAAGVRHELFSRVLPTMRHDMVAPASVIRMGLLLLKRQVATPVIDVAACEKYIDLLGEQVSDMVSGMRSLRDWDLANRDDDITRTQLVAECDALLRPQFELRGVSLIVDGALLKSEDDCEAQAEGEARWAAAVALRYLLIGALCHLHDVTSDVGAIHIDPEGAGALCLTAKPRPADSEAPPPVEVSPRRSLAIDALALQVLADDLGYSVTMIAADTVRLALQPG